jgi:acyl-[acyl carrier protein]--UDP-N-acetylglucosamine O-acyltransferase
LKYKFLEESTYKEIDNDSESSVIGDNNRVRESATLEGGLFLEIIWVSDGGQVRLGLGLGFGLG